MTISDHWPVALDLLPGGHAIVFGSWETGLEGRKRGLELRDTLMVISDQEPRFAFLFRRGLEGTVAETVLKYGTGGLNIDACRVGSIEGNPSINRREVARRTGRAPIPGSAAEAEARGRIERRGSPSVYMEDRASEHLGRWPTNLVFIHGEGCKRDGVKTVLGSNGGGMRRDGANNLVYGKHSGHPQVEVVGYADASGQETIPNWLCTPECPVRALDEQGKQAGIHSSGSPRGYKAGYTTEPGYTGSWSTNPYGGMRHDDGDAGSCASRFFPQFVNEEALLIWLKMLIGAAV